MSALRFRQRFFGVVAVGVIAALAAPDRTAVEPAPEAPVEEVHEVTSFELAGQIARYALAAESGKIVVASANGRTHFEFAASVIVDGVERPVVVRKADVSRRPHTLTATFPVQIGQDRATATLELRVDQMTDALIASVAIPLVGSESHALALRLTAMPGLAAVFLPRQGELADLGDVETNSVVLDDDVHPVGVIATKGTFTVAESAPELETQSGMKPRVTSTFKLEAAPGESPRAETAILLGDSSDVFWGKLYGMLGVEVARVSGIVSGTNERAEVVAIDDDGRPLVRVPTSAGGRFVVDVPLDARRWFASLEAARTSTAVVPFKPGGTSELKLDVFPGGELRVRVIDPDTGLPVLARVVVRGIDGAVDPTFGHDFRASGAGPLVDIRSGELKTSLPPGRYRVSALKGIEWSIDAEDVTIVSGHAKHLELQPRHVVPTPGLVACDLHVHARPSFDSTVSPEDRLLSLASAGIDFAVPTEHNMIGDYAPGVDHMDLKGSLAHVTGIEVTTYNPRIGHFGVFPYPKTSGPVPFKQTSVSAVFSAARRGDPSRVLVVHHPRLPQGIGYFQLMGFDTKTGKIPAGMRTDFDVLEVYNGYEIATRAKTETVLADWFALLNLGKRYPASGSSDSHRIQFQWAGYPRTYVQLDPSKAGDTGAPIDTTAVVAAVKKGMGFVTSGPVVELTVSGARPGSEIQVRGGHVTAHLLVRAAPWVDVSTIELVAGSATVYHTALTSSPAITGKESGTIEDAAARSVRFESDIELSIPSGAKWLVAVVRGDHAYDDVLPFMHVQPLAFTNPIWLK